MYEDGKEPQVRFEVDVSLSEIIRAGRDSSLDSAEAVEVAVVLKLMDRADHQRWSRAAAMAMVSKLLMAGVPSIHEVNFDLAVGEDWQGKYDEMLDEWQSRADSLTFKAMRKMREFDAEASLEESRRMSAD